MRRSRFLDGDETTLYDWLEREVPVICAIQAGELQAYSDEWFQHVVVVIGGSTDGFWLLDPLMTGEPHFVEVNEFMLAWSWMAYQYAIIQKA